MDLKRYEQITSEEAIKRIISKEEVFDEDGKRFFSLGKSNTVWIQTEQPYGSVNSSSGHTLEDLLDKKWFIKKPFDVRAEMLARPDEWVGAFRNKWNAWCKVGLNSESMYAVETKFKDPKPVRNNFGCFQTTISELDRCIPIEDVPKEEL